MVPGDASRSPFVEVLGAESDLSYIVSYVIMFPGDASRSPFVVSKLWFLCK